MDKKWMIGIAVTFLTIASFMYYMHKEKIDEPNFNTTLFAFTPKEQAPKVPNDKFLLSFAKKEQITPELLFSAYLLAYNNETKLKIFKIIKRKTPKKFIEKVKALTKTSSIEELKSLNKDYPGDTVITSNLLGKILKNKKSEKDINEAIKILDNLNFTNNFRESFNITKNIENICKQANITEAESKYTATLFEHMTKDQSLPIHLSSLANLLLPDEEYLTEESREIYNSTFKTQADKEKTLKKLSKTAKNTKDILGLLMANKFEIRIYKIKNNSETPNNHPLIQKRECLKKINKGTSSTIRKLPKERVMTYMQNLLKYGEFYALKNLPEISRVLNDSPCKEVQLLK